MEGLDWFNAGGFAADQLRTVILTTLSTCPKDDSEKVSENGFRARLAKEYDFQWDRLGSDRSQLLEYDWAEVETGRTMLAGRFVARRIYESVRASAMT